MQNIKLFLSAIALIYVCLCALLYFYQRDLLYFPSPEYEHHYPTEIFLSEGESIKVITLNQGKKNAILFFGGNAEAVVKDAPNHINNFPNHALYLINYRGYGGSTGTVTESNLYADALSIYDRIKERHHKISVIGRSLGSGVATYLVSKRMIEKMILITPYDSIERVAQAKYPIFPVSLILKDKFDSISRAKKIKSTTLVLLAEHDYIIPFANSQRLIDALPASITSTRIIQHADHNNISTMEAFNDELSRFMQLK